MCWLLRLSLPLLQVQKEKKMQTQFVPCASSAVTWPEVYFIFSITVLSPKQALCSQVFHQIRLPQDINGCSAAVTGKSCTAACLMVSTSGLLFRCRYDTDNCQNQRVSGQNSVLVAG